MAKGVHRITKDFEDELSRYTGAKYVIAVDNQSNALFLALTYEKVSGVDIEIPSNTYPSVPCEIIHAGGVVKFIKSGTDKLTGAYQLKPTKVWDSALRFTHNMYIENTHMCISFTGPYKHLKLGKGGAILTDDIDAYKWFKKARFSGRSECNYMDDDFDSEPCIGWNFYMMPEISAKGLLLILQFYNQDGSPKANEDLTISYPDLSQFEIYKNKLK